MKVTLEGGKKYTPNDDEVVSCEEHGVRVRWGDLSDIQQLAVSEGIDVEGDRCILDPHHRRAVKPGQSNQRSDDQSRER